jgi:arginine N-succinyltransferase
MWLVRPAETRDLEGLMELAEEVSPGMTTLPPDRDTLGAKIELSTASFAAGLEPAASTQYLLALSDTDTGQILGCAGLYSNVGQPYGFFSYRLVKQLRHSVDLALTCPVELLQLTSEYTGVTEVGTLAVRSCARRMGVGQMLAKSRYMLLAAFPNLFNDRIISELRGWQDEKGLSPFWEAVGAHFFGMSFTVADRLSAVSGNRFIADLLPEIPIHASLLPAAARAAIARPHISSAIAMKMLEREGFKHEGMVDVFDAGPQLVARRKEISAVRCSRPYAARASRQGGRPSRRTLIATTEQRAFAVFQASALVDEKDNSLDLGGSPGNFIEAGQRVLGLAFDEMEAEE